MSDASPPPPVHFACRVMAAGTTTSTARSVITVSTEEGVVYCPDFRLSKVLAFQYDRAYSEATPLYDLYQSSVEALAVSAARGSSAMCVVCGEDASGKRMLTEGRPHYRVDGLMGMAAETLFESLARDVNPDEWQVAVRVSWYQIQDDVIVDLLRKAGMGGGGGGGSGSGGKDLVMRDHPTLGVTVPNLWEVEIRSAEDVRALVNSVNPESSLPDPACHSVWTFSVVKTPVVPYSTSATQPSSPSTVVSALKFMSLANSTAPPAGRPAGDLSPWIKALHRVLSKLERRSPAAPFHLSRVTLALRDTLCGKHHSSFIGLVSPSIDATPLSTATLNIVGRIRSVVRAFEGIDASAAVSSVGLRTEDDGPSPVFPQRPVASPSTTSSPRRAAKSSGDLFRIPTTPGSPDRTHDNTFLRTVASAARASAKALADPDPASPSPTTGGLNDTFTHSLINMTAASGGAGSGSGGGGGGGAAAGSGSMMNGTGTAATMASGGGLSTGPTPSPAGGPDDSAMHASELWTSTIRSGTGGAGLGLSGGASTTTSGFLPDSSSAGDPMLRAEQIASRMAILSARGDESARWFTALLTALEASRAEARELKERVEVLQRETSDLVAERDGLREALTAVTTTQVPAQTAEAVSATVKDLKRRLKASEQEVKDYELYKDVMETAVCRMQDTMQDTINERDQFRKSLRAAHAATRREREELLAARRRVSDLELELETHLKQASATDKTVQRALAQAKRQADRAAQHQENSLAMFRDEAETEMERLRAELALARTENEDLRQRLFDTRSRDAAESDDAARELASARDALAVSQITNAALRKRAGGRTSNGRPPVLPPSARGGSGASSTRSPAAREAASAVPDSSMDTDALFTLAHGVAQSVTELVTPKRGGGRAPSSSPSPGGSGARRPPPPPRATAGTSASSRARRGGRGGTRAANRVRSSPSSNKARGRAALIAGLKKEMGSVNSATSRARAFKP